MRGGHANLAAVPHYGHQRARGGSVEQQLVISTSDRHRNHAWRVVVNDEPDVTHQRLVKDRVDGVAVVDATPRVPTNARSLLGGPIFPSAVIAPPSLAPAVSA